ncbi:hypothetical protein VTO73DRAFT_3791 [Trametes versicolor]
MNFCYTTRVYARGRDIIGWSSLSRHEHEQRRVVPADGVYTHTVWGQQLLHGRREKSGISRGGEKGKKAG